jgi:Winged helix DNA-binding domain
VPDPWIVARRLHASGLTEPRFTTPEAVVGWFGAVQSQDMPGSMWGIGQRLPVGTVSADVEAALDEGRILRTHTMRPTWHYVLPTDIRWILTLTSPRVQQLCGTYYRKLGLDAATLARGADVIARALEGGRHLTKMQLTEELDRAGQPTAELRDAFTISYAELEGVICSGPRSGKIHTYALLEERVPPAPARERDDALAELTRRYFSSHGPAEARDFAWWSGLTVADAKAGLAMLGDAAVRETIGGTDWWWVPSALGEVTALPSPTVHLLPNYDEYLVSYRDHDVALDQTLLGGRRLYDVFYFHVIVRDGLLIGGWRRKVDKREALVVPDLLVDLSEEDRGPLRRAVEGYGRFLGLPARLEG